MDDNHELVAAARSLAERLGRSTITESEFVRLGGLRGNPGARARRRYGTWTAFCRAAGIVPNRPRSVRIPDDELFRAMRDAILATGGVTTFWEFTRHFSHGVHLLYRRGWRWRVALHELRKWAERNDPGFPYLAQLPAEPPPPPPPDKFRRRTTAPRVPGKPTFGDPFGFRCFLNEPVNEPAVMMLFAVVASEFGFAIESTQAAFPDCEAKRRVARGLWQRVRIEFEYQSRNFREHAHDPAGCDLIVCWEHNWPECPVPVFELRTKIAALTGRR